MINLCIFNRFTIITNVKHLIWKFSNEICKPVRENTKRMRRYDCSFRVRFKISSKASMILFLAMMMIVLEAYILKISMILSREIKIKRS
jgi:hypothetical protein